MKTISRILGLAVSFLPAVIAWFVCPWLIRHGSSAAFDMAIFLGGFAVFCAIYGVMLFQSEGRK